MRRLIAIGAVIILLAAPAVVQASAYSPVTYWTNWTPPGLSTTAAACDQSAVIDTAQNYNQSLSKYYLGSGVCTGGSYTLPAGYLGSQVEGYRDGSMCAWSPTYYSNTATSAWQLWITLCSNPAGTQTFYSYGRGYYYTTAGYFYTDPIRSPSQNY